MQEMRFSCFLIFSIRLIGVRPGGWVYIQTSEPALADPPEILPAGRQVIICVALPSGVTTRRPGIWPDSDLPTGRQAADS